MSDKILSDVLLLLYEDYKKGLITKEEKHVIKGIFLL